MDIAILERIEDKIDKIIQHNSITDSKIAVIESELRRHDTSDEKTFEAITKKHDLYDRILLAAGGFTIAQLVAILIAILK